MFRLLCLSPFFSFAAQGSTPAKYIIKKGAYLVEAPPKRPISGYALFVKENTAGKHLKVENTAPELSKKWSLYPELKEKYTKLANEMAAGYDQRKQQYEKKFVEPFKKSSAQTIRMKNLFKDKKIDFKKGEGIKGVGEQIKKAMKEIRTLEADEKLRDTAKKLNEEREAIKKAFLFPQLMTPTLRAYRARHALPEAERGPNYQQEMEAGFKAELEKWKASVKKWLEDNKYELTIEEFLILVEKDKKDKKKAKKEQEQEHDSDDY